MSRARKILVTGSSGRLGSELVDGLSDDYTVNGITRDDADITDSMSIDLLIENFRPDLVLHTAALTNVDQCEEDPKLAMATNSEGANNVASACNAWGCRMIYFSTDYVFDGRKGGAYVESDTPNPINAYGRSKLAGEQAVIAVLADPLIVRVARLYSRYRPDFVSHMIAEGYRRQEGQPTAEALKPIQIIEGQLGNPTWTREIVGQVRILIENDASGLYHCAAEGGVSRHELVEAIFSHYGWEQEIEGCKAEELSEAPRPADSRLECAQLKADGAFRMRPWREALEEFLRQHGKEICSGA